MKGHFEVFTYPFHHLKLYSIILVFQLHDSLSCLDRGEIRQGRLARGLLMFRVVRELSPSSAFTVRFHWVAISVHRRPSVPGPLNFGPRDFEGNLTPPLMSHDFLPFRLRLFPHSHETSPSLLLVSPTFKAGIQSVDT